MSTPVCPRAVPGILSTGMARYTAPMDEQQLQPPAAVAQLLHLIACASMSQVLATAAELGIADELASGPKSLEDLARSSPCHAPSLRRLLRGLAAVGACIELKDGSFDLTELGHLLRSDSTISMHGTVLWWAHYRWPAWEQLTHSVMTGQSSIGIGAASVGMKQLESEPHAASIFNQAMAELSHFVAQEVVRIYPFSGAGQVVDVGGGYGKLLESLLVAYPGMRGVLFDQAHAINSTRQRLEKSGIAERCDFTVGDFFIEVPTGADFYVLKRILHDWDDEESSVILTNCHRAMPSHAKLLVIEQIVPEQVTTGEPAGPILADLNMLVMLGGRERTMAEFKALLEAAGFEIANAFATTLNYIIIEAYRV